MRRLGATIEEAVGWEVELKRTCKGKPYPHDFLDLF
jgi:hypothetical protein